MRFDGGHRSGREVGRGCHANVSEAESGETMAIEMAVLPQGTRVRVRQADLPMEEGIPGRTGTVVVASDYASRRLGVALDGEQRIRMFTPAELEVVQEVPLPPERETAKKRPALP